MFTGLIQGLGQLRSQGPGQLSIMTQSKAILSGLAIGDSVAVDGICLTVEHIQSEGFTVTTSPETLDRSTLETYINTPWLANLEPALRVGDRLGGHFVTGHVDGIGQVVEVETTQDAWRFAFNVPTAIARLIVSKGSITVNGISLTVADCTDSGHHFSVAVIPHSFESTNLHLLETGMAVNLETDVLGKYVERLLQFGVTDSVTTAVLNPINASFLREHGYS